MSLEKADATASATSKTSKLATTGWYRCSGTGKSGMLKGSRENASPSMRRESCAGKGRPVVKPRTTNCTTWHS
eukprot:CAMPEP_0115367606 /NCGR_PEP_ID=MMETSP0270-20121206/105399_1 /TAXON_ID=71861 /ORGANISM="Scrippsiella trochoidea, Strain CCMP3099" /LENGTH=72 /DNA_ID=CAMNT_0002790397 /DNA_START=28 /DNA_END=246 /DNA_ORIENTATION=+